MPRAKEPLLETPRMTEQHPAKMPRHRQALTARWRSHDTLILGNGALFNCESQGRIPKTRVCVAIQRHLLIALFLLWTPSVTLADVLFGTSQPRPRTILPGVSVLPQFGYSRGFGIDRGQL